MTFVVTDVRLEASMLRSIKRLAVERGVPASVLIREALENYLATPHLSERSWKRELKEFLKVCGVRTAGGVRHGSTDIDEVLYGPLPRRKRRR
jgi:hypothetical protein